ncbi:Nuclear transport factor 2 [Entomortierella beljakovae]|nr:Nuclear transport factor 2 [Entomortierella beljakovae]
MAEIEAVANQFIAYYYETFDSNRNNLKALYRPSSQLSFEGAPFVGEANISEKLASLPFNTVRHSVASKDIQVSQGSLVIISVTGQLLVDDEANPQFFAQTFVLKHDGTSFFVENDIFRLVYAFA